MSDASQSSRENEQAPRPGALSKGMVLGKDGKPCRTCTTFASMRAASAAAVGTSTTASTPSTQTPPTAAAIPQLPPDCPPDVERLGNHTWTLLHTLTATYPERPNPADKAKARGFVDAFSKVYPCEVCREDFEGWLGQEERSGSYGKALEGREFFGRFMCRAHNEVNVKLGKGVFNCDNWWRRWGEGPGGKCG